MAKLCPKSHQLQVHILSGIFSVGYCSLLGSFFKKCLHQIIIKCQPFNYNCVYAVLRPEEVVVETLALDVKISGSNWRNYAATK